MGNGGLWAMLGAGLALAGAAGASPWGRPAGETFLSSRLDAYSAHDAVQDFDQLNVQTYGEIGVGGDWLIGGTFATTTQRIDREAGGSELRGGVSQAELFAQAPLPGRGRYALAAGFLVALPTETRPLTGIGAARRTDGAGEAAISAGLSGSPGFVTGRTGYRRSFGGDADQIRIETVVGRHLTERVLLLAEGQTIVSVGGADPDGADFSVAAVSPSVVWRAAERYFFQLGGRADIWGRDLTLGQGLFVALWVVR